MARTLFWLSWMMLYLIRKVPLYWRVRRQQRLGNDQQALAMMREEVVRWATTLLRHIKVNLIVEGAENLPKNGEPVLFVSNHQSYIDIPVLLAGLDMPHPLMAKKQLGKVPFLSLWMKALGCIFVDRDDVRASVKAMGEGEALLAQGRSLIICPEGTRSKADKMGEFKLGGIRMAKKTGVPIVPVAIDGTYLVLEGNDYKLQGADVRLVILPPVPTAGLDRAAFRELPTRLHDAIEAAKNARGPDIKPPRV